ncbi:SDR family oxidoreductase [Lactococcus cremoris]|uniref:SDR family oxidoreductase n=1 Tax=Lactococcus lactis subsp. cremoris TaxID=1359 RepID=UPI001C2579D6|nr:SDR family oxidoreductase [Lactococcus cremoris]MBU8904715.1 SDR family oxidoreductase [Lactococcus cremoris]MCT0488207.1 SDR family oxidoreductase [Lactococcus cremoris]MCT4455030.1 SDR family oxidoreductase [Lactococcus cremoris]
MSNNIENKVVLITGASSGIGQSTAELLAKKGAKIVLAARRESRLKELADKINKAGGQAIYQVTDVTNPEDSKKLVQYAKEKFGKVDAFFLNAGIMPSSPLSALHVEEWESMVDINLKGVLNGLAAVLPEFTAQKSGHVITTSSVAGLKAYPNGGVYGATKWAVRELMEVLRMESAQEGTNIRTATIYPAAINTELLNTITDTEAAKGMAALYEQYGISPEAIARIVAFALEQPADVNVSEFTVGPTSQPW